MPALTSVSIIELDGFGHLVIIVIFLFMRHTPGFIHTSVWTSVNWWVDYSGFGVMDVCCHDFSYRVLRLSLGCGVLVVSLHNIGQHIGCLWILLLV